MKKINFIKHKAKLKEFEIVLLIIGILLEIFVSLKYQVNLIVFVCSITGIASALLIAKAKPIGNVFGIILVILYSYISYKNHLYGEVIIYMCLSLPLYIASLIKWQKNKRKDNKTVIAYEISDLEWAILASTEGLLFIGVYFLLEKLNTEMLILSTFSFISLIYTTYLGFRRNKYSFLWYLINDVVLVILWGSIYFLKGNHSVVPLIVSPLISCIYDVYGIIFWKRNNADVKKVYTNYSYRKLSKLCSNLKTGDIAYFFDMLPEYAYLDNQYEKSYIESRINAMKNGAQVHLFIIGDAKKLKKVQNNKLFEYTINSCYKNSKIYIINTDGMNDIDEFLYLANGLDYIENANGMKTVFRDIWTDNDNVGIIIRDESIINFVQKTIKSINEKIASGKIKLEYFKESN